jgi:hypothetical protein
MGYMLWDEVWAQANPDVDLIDASALDHTRQ